MANGLNFRTNPSSFEEELAGVSREDQQALAEAQELERMYALQEARNESRRQSQLAQAAKGLAKTEAKKMAKVAGKRAALWLTESAVGTVAASVAGALSTVALAIAGIILVIVVVIAALYYSCNSEGITGYISVGISRLAQIVGSTSFDVCSMFSGATSAPVVRDATAENISRDTEGDSAARAYLLMNNIGINAPAPQTSLDGILQSTLEEVVRIKAVCDVWAASQTPPRAPDPVDADTPPARALEDSYCNVVVTGGTERGHSTTGTCIHSAGWKIDLRVTPNVNAFLSTYQPINPPSYGIQQYYNSRTNTRYTLETNPDHWDISVGCA